jgi:hypothetical protein
MSLVLTTGLVLVATSMSGDFPSFKTGVWHWMAALELSADKSNKKVKFSALLRT